jgi:transcriptional regulator with PAS, ATPase and Fis domain
METKADFPGNCHPKREHKSGGLTASRENKDSSPFREMNRLLKDLGGDPAKPITLPASSAPSSTFVEIGEMMAQDQRIFLYASERMQRVKEMIDQVANTDVTIFIQGESGVGKEVVARSIHMNSVRRDKPFVKVNCAALPHELLESELFGYEKGAFTGAYRQKPGKFELADSGTIFLDEIGDISPALQAKLLQVLQDREFSRLGGKKDVKVDVRVLVATNKNIEEAVVEGRFREDLYYRLNVVNITIPPLRERKEEIPELAEYFLNKFAKKYKKGAKPLSDSLMRALLAHNWPGNVRELQNVIQRYLLLGNEGEILRGFSLEIKEDDVRAAEKEDILMNNLSLKQIHWEVTRKAEASVVLQ